MAELRGKNVTGACTLEPEHLVGRGPQCSLRLTGAYVSAQHAVIRWNGSHWELLDRASHNGTALNGHLVEPGSPHVLSENDVLAFGHAAEQWVMVDTSAPQSMVVDVGTGLAVSGVNGVIGVPSTANPVCTVFRDANGHFKLEHADEPLRLLHDGDRFECGGQVFRFVRALAVGGTETSDHPALDAPETTLLFSVSRDEEYVSLALREGERRVDLGARAQNYLLLTLARRRTADSDLTLPESARGWMYKEDLADALKMSPAQVDGEVFRIRQHFAQHGVPEAASIIERRPRTRQLRIGIGRVVIESV
jgi:pSer/pThr/pTyr-binding forkhead associated (FHA) protein